MQELTNNKKTENFNYDCDVDKSWTLYLHTVPKEISGYDWDKYYVGITKTKPEYRWGKNGNGYKRQSFWNAIEKYGWDNIKHEVMFENLTLEEANLKEIELIDELNCFNSKYGYNNTYGGDSNKHFSKPLAQYDQDGNFIKLFSSCEEAERIYGCLSINSNISRNFIWKQIKDINNIPQKIDAYKNPFLSEPLEQFDFNGNYIKTFGSLFEARKIYPNLSIRKKQKNGTVAYGYQWKYKDSDVFINDISNSRYVQNKVYVYNIDGTFFKEFDNKKEATKVINPHDINRFVPNHIFDNIYNNEYLGYRWTRDYYEKLPELIKITGRDKPVIQIDPIDNKIIDIYPSCTIAETYFINKSKKPHGISESCRNKHIAHGYMWVYFEDYIFKESSIDDSFLLQKYKIYKSILNNKKEDT